MNFKERILKSSIYGLIGHIVRIAIAFMLTPFLMRSLGEEGYGLWLLIIATLGWFRFVDFGFSAAVQRSIAIALEANDVLKINTIFSCSILLFGLFGILAAAALIILSFFPQLLGIDSQYFSIVHISLMVFSIKLFWDLGMCSFHGFFSGLIRFDIDANIDMANDIIKAILIIALVSNLNIIGAVIATMVADFICNIAKIFYAKKLFPPFKFSYKLISVKEIKDLYSYSKHVVAIAIASSFSVGVDALIISHLLGLKFVAIYGVASRLVGFVETAFLVVLDTFIPVFTRLIERKGDIRPETEQVFGLNIFLVSIFFVPLIMFSDDFIYLWLGEGFEATHIVVTAVSIAAICRSISRPITQLLLARSEHKLISVVKLVGVFINLILSIILGSIYGFAGIAYATIISFYVSDVILHFILYRYYTKYPISRIAINFLTANILVLALSYTGFYYLKGIDQLSWLELIFFSGIVFFLSITLFWFLILAKDTKNKIIEVAYSNSSIAKLLKRFSIE